MVLRLTRHESNQIECSIKYLKEEGRNVLLDSEQSGVLVTTDHQTLGSKGPELQADGFYSPTSKTGPGDPDLRSSCSLVPALPHHLVRA